MASALTTIDLSGLSYWDTITKTTLQAQIQNTSDTVLTLNSTNGTNNACSLTNASSISMVDNDAGAGTFTMKPSATTTTYEVTWPPAVASGDGYVLKSTTAGILSWGQDSGNEWKEPVRVATTENLLTLVGLLTIDGVTLAAGDRVLVKNQTTATQNGIWVAAAGGWTRSADMAAAAPNSFSYGFSVIATEGTINANRGWVQSTYQGDIGVDNLVFLDLVSAAGSVSEIQINDPNNEKGFATSSTINNGVTLSQSIFNYTINPTGLQSFLEVGNNATATGNSVFIVKGSDSTGLGSNNKGSTIGLQPGSGTGTFSGGDLGLQSGQGDPAGTGNGGQISFQAGFGGNAGVGGNGGAISINSGLGGGTNGNSGIINIISSGTQNAGVGGNVTLASGPSIGGTGNSGNVQITSGLSNSSGNAGNIFITGGSCSGAGDGGNVTITSGQSTGGGTFGDITLKTGTFTATDNGFIFQSGSSTDLIFIRGASENSTTNVPGAGQGTLHVTGGGSFTQDVYANTFNATSDIRMKENITGIDNPLDKLKSIEGYMYDWKDKSLNNGKRQLGVIAQQLEKVGLSDIVTGTEDNKAVNYLALIPLLVEAVKEIADNIK